MSYYFYELWRFAHKSSKGSERTHFDRSHMWALLNNTLSHSALGLTSSAKHPIVSTNFSSQVARYQKIVVCCTNMAKVKPTSSDEMDSGGNAAEPTMLINNKSVGQVKAVSVHSQTVPSSNCHREYDTE